MKRTKWRQETRLMRFEDAYEGWTEQRLTQDDQQHHYLVRIRKVSKKVKFQTYLSNKADFIRQVFVRVPAIPFCALASSENRPRRPILAKYDGRE